MEDLHYYQERLETASRKIQNSSNICEENKKLAEQFKDWNALRSTSTSRQYRYLSSLKQILEHNDFRLENLEEALERTADLDDLEDMELEEVDPDEIKENAESESLEEYPGIGEITAETNSWENRINQYQAAAEELGFDPDLIYEPANGADTSTPEAFPEADVLFAEIAEHNVEAVNEEGYDSVLADGEELKLSRTPDLVVFRNAMMDETKALENNPAEYVFANNYPRMNGNASGIAEMDEYEIVGTVRQNGTTFNRADSVEAGETPDDLYLFQKVV